VVSIPDVQEQVVIRGDSSWHIPFGNIAQNHLQDMTLIELDHDLKLQDFFGVIAVINLPRCKDRLTTMTQELEKVGVLSFDLFKAVDGSKEVDPAIWKKFKGNRERIDSSTSEGAKALDKLHMGEAGCFMSHYQLIKKTNEAFKKALRKWDRVQSTNDQHLKDSAAAKVRKYSRILVLEDDCGFGIVNAEKTEASSTGVGSILRQSLSELPDDWGMLYFTVKVKEPTTQFAPHLYKIKKSYGTVAYALNFTMYDTLLKHLKQIEDPLVTKILSIDCHISSIHHKHKVFAMYPSIVFHKAGVSEISSKMRELLQEQPIFVKDKK
jgi:GR25 family glycosyltransferase involved in LPS biosynthesis